MWCDACILYLYFTSGCSTSKLNSQVQPALSLARLDASIADMQSSLTPEDQDEEELQQNPLGGIGSSSGVSTESRILPLVNMGKGLLTAFVKCSSCNHLVK